MNDDERPAQEPFTFLPPRWISKRDGRRRTSSEPGDLVPFPWGRVEVSIRTKIAKSTAAGLAGVMALSAVAIVPSFAHAQGAYDSSGYYYDPCRRDKTNRATVGGVIGALAGAAIGSNVAARGVRTE